MQALLTKEHELRTVRFSPYRKGMGPTFTLKTWETGLTCNTGQSRIAYRLTMHENGKRTVLFEGDDFGCSPMHCVDSDESIAGLMGFLTLRPGDTDREYFDNYTPEQLAYCEQHAEMLSCYVMDRFGDN